MVIQLQYENLKKYLNDCEAFYSALFGFLNELSCFNCFFDHQIDSDFWLKHFNIEKYRKYPSVKKNVSIAFYYLMINNEFKAYKFISFAINSSTSNSNFYYLRSLISYEYNKDRLNDAKIALKLNQNARNYFNLGIKLEKNPQNDFNNSYNTQKLYCKAIELDENFSCAYLNKICKNYNKLHDYSYERHNINRLLPDLISAIRTDTFPSISKYKSFFSKHITCGDYPGAIEMLSTLLIHFSSNPDLIFLKAYLEYFFTFSNQIIDETRVRYLEHAIFDMNTFLSLEIHPYKVNISNYCNTSYLFIPGTVFNPSHILYNDAFDIYILRANAHLLLCHFRQAFEDYDKYLNITKKTQKSLDRIVNDVRKIFPEGEFMSHEYFSILDFYFSLYKNIHNYPSTVCNLYIPYYTHKYNIDITNNNPFYITLKNGIISIIEKIGSEFLSESYFSDREALTLIEKDICKLRSEFDLYDIIHFGKYKGKEIIEIIEIEADYIIWCIFNILHFVVTNQVFLFYNIMKQQYYNKAIEINCVKILFINEYYPYRNSYDTGDLDYYSSDSYFDGGGGNEWSDPFEFFS